MGEHVQGLQICYAQCVWEIDLYVESEGLEYALFSSEKGRAATLVRAFGDEIRGFGRLLLELIQIDKRRRYGGEVCVDIYDAPR